MTIRVDVSPDILRWAVDRAGWDAETVARRAPRFLQWIDKSIRPTLKQLEQFAADTNIPFGVLFLSEPPEERIPIPDLRSLGNKPVPRPSGNLMDTFYACQQRQNWYRDYLRADGAEDLDFVGSVTTSTDPLLVAAEIRERLDFQIPQRTGFGNWQAAFRFLIDRVEALGVLVMVSGIVGTNTHRKLDSEEFRGFALSDRIAPLLFINGSDTKAAQIFTLIHELGHLWLGGSALSDASAASESVIVDELWCNQVAAEVLVPLASIHDVYRGSNAKDLDRLARYYRVSTLVVLKRIHDAGLLTWDEFQHRYDAERNRVLEHLNSQKSSGGDFYNTLPLRVSRRFAQSVLVSTLEGTTTYRDAFRLLGVRKQEAFDKLAQRLVAA